MVREKVMNGFENYIVYSDGRIFSINSKRFLDWTIDKQDNIKKGLLYSNGKKKSFKLHRIIAECFVVNDDTENKTQVTHLDGNTLNNDATNLMWVTPQTSSLRAHRVKKSYNLEKSLKVSDSEIIEIINNFNENKDLETLFSKYSHLAKNTIRLYLRDKCRSDLMDREFRVQVSELYDSLIDLSKRGRKYSDNSNTLDRTIPPALLNFNEEYQIISEFDKFAITSHGRIYSFSRKIFRSLEKDAAGYSLITLSEIGRKKTFKVHRLVGHAFVKGFTEERCYINHIDLNKSNNHHTNLEWVTPLENNLHYVQMMDK